MKGLDQRSACRGWQLVVFLEVIFERAGKSGSRHSDIATPANVTFAHPRLSPPCVGTRSRQFDHRQLSRPRDMNEATTRITYNTRAFSGNYLVIILILAVWALCVISPIHSFPVC